MEILCRAKMASDVDVGKKNCKRIYLDSNSEPDLDFDAFMVRERCLLFKMNVLTRILS